MALNRSDKSRILRRYFPGMTRNSEMSTEPSLLNHALQVLSHNITGPQILRGSQSQSHLEDGTTYHPLRLT